MPTNLIRPCRAPVGGALASVGPQRPCAGKLCHLARAFVRRMTPSLPGDVDASKVILAPSARLPRVAVAGAAPRHVRGSSHGSLAIDRAKGPRSAGDRFWRAFNGRTAKDLGPDVDASEWRLARLAHLARATPAKGTRA